MTALWARLPRHALTVGIGRGINLGATVAVTALAARLLEPTEFGALVLGRLTAEAMIRRASVTAVLEALHPGAALVGGDLNSGPRSDPSRILVDAGLVDAHAAAGRGPGFTRFEVPLGFRIDALFSRGLEPVRAWTVGGLDSDHRPVLVAYDWSP